ncbi:hypothetical protein PR202_gb17773 [Eleusine coracana subsp. coracana]|uniref:DUF569 domain-containing protein n=1 Tax=Eleusine coracana subsp. coracana TaxID=191504 RepID=A0AAV5F4I6_ELECO|nr:hypothetical protein PR202_gb17773 [Eleusine coracana subsp. coracana]
MVEKKRKREALEQFPDGRRVRLRSRARAGMYLHADEDGKGVSLSPPLPASPLNASVYGDDEKDAVCWSPRTVAAGDDHVILQDLDSSCRRFLRANGKYCRWRTGVTVGKYAHQDVMMHWVVETIPAMPLAPELPLPRPAAPPGSFWDKLLRRAAPVLERRNIRFVQAADDGTIDPDKNWGIMEFHGVSVLNLRSELAKQLSQQGNEDGIKLGVRAGNLGRMIPLITDLPRDGNPMDIIVIATSAPNATGPSHADQLPDTVNGSLSADSLLTPAVVSDPPEIEAGISLIVHSANAPDLPCGQENIDIVALTAGSPDGVPSLQNPATDKTVRLSQGTEPDTKGDEFSDIPATPETIKPKEIHQEGGKGPTTASVGDALGEQPGIGIVIAQERNDDAYFLLDDAQEGLKRIEEKLQDKKVELRKELTKEQEKMLLKEVSKLKDDRNKQMILCARLEQEADAAAENVDKLLAGHHNGTTPGPGRTGCVSGMTAPMARFGTPCWAPPKSLIATQLGHGGTPFFWRDSGTSLGPLVRHAKTRTRAMLHGGMESGLLRRLLA